MRKHPRDHVWQSLQCWCANYANWHSGGVLRNVALHIGPIWPLYQHSICPQTKYLIPHTKTISVMMSKTRYPCPLLWLSFTALTHTEMYMCMHTTHTNPAHIMHHKHDQYCHIINTSCIHVITYLGVPHAFATRFFFFFWSQSIAIPPGRPGA